MLSADQGSELGLSPDSESITPEWIPEAVESALEEPSDPEPALLGTTTTVKEEVTPSTTVMQPVVTVAVAVAQVLVTVMVAVT